MKQNWKRPVRKYTKFYKKRKINVQAVAKIREMDSLAEFVFTIIFFHISVTQSTEEIGKYVMSKLSNFLQLN